MTSSERFINAISALLNGNFFTSATDISHFLTTLAADADLRATLQTSVDGFRSEEDYKKVFFDNQPLPEQPEKVVAILTAFLFRVDANQVSLSDALSRLFPDLDSANAYKAFGKVYLQPYAESFITLLTGTATEDAEGPKPVYDKMNEDIVTILEAMEQESRPLPLPDDLREELVDAIRGMKYALTFNDAILTAFSYHRIAFLTAKFQINLVAEQELRSVLVLYGVL